jgi:hypothetical protein
MQSVLSQRDCRIPVWRVVETEWDRESLARHPDLYSDTCRSESITTNVRAVQIVITCSSVMRYAISEMQHIFAELTVHQFGHSAMLWTNSSVETESYARNLWRSINSFTVRWTKLACSKVDVCLVWRFVMDVVRFNQSVTHCLDRLHQITHPVIYRNFKPWPSIHFTAVVICSVLHVVTSLYKHGKHTILKVISKNRRVSALFEFLPRYQLSSFSSATQAIPW